MKTENVMTLSTEIAFLEGKLDKMGINPNEKDLANLLDEPSDADAIRSQISKIERKISDIKNSEKLKAAGL
jgi:hypothetical protein